MIGRHLPQRLAAQTRSAKSSFDKSILAFLETMKENLAGQSSGKLSWNALEFTAISLFRGDPTLQLLRDRLFAKIAQRCVKFGLSANRTSMLGVFFAIVAAVSVGNAAVFAIALVLNMFCDGLDGVIARQEKKDNDVGSITDITCDTLSALFVALGLTLHGHLSWILLLIFSISMCMYTWRSMLKSKLLNGVYRSVGSRIFTFAGLSVIAILGVWKVEFFGTDQLIVIVSVLLGGALFCDIVWTRLRLSFSRSP